MASRDPCTCHTCLEDGGAGGAQLMPPRIVYALASLSSLACITLLQRHAILRWCHAGTLKHVRTLSSRAAASLESALRKAFALPPPRAQRLQQKADAAVAGLPFCEAELHFSAGTHRTSSGERPPPTRLRIHDARGEEARFRLHEHSFELVRAPPYDRSLDLYDAAAVVARLYPQIEQLLLSQLPGATRVLIFDHLLRKRSREAAELAEARRRAGAGADESTLQPKTRFLGRPVEVVHGDYTARSGYSRARQLLQPYCSEEEIDGALRERFVFVNVWHHFGARPAQTDPLALCVWGSFTPRDVRTRRLIFPHRTGETYQASFSKQQRWVYFSELSREEALLIKVFDSRDDGETSRFSVHSAFRLPEQLGADAASLVERESVELRAVVLYGKGLESIAPNFQNASMAGPDAPPKVQEQARLTEQELYMKSESHVLDPSEEW